MSSEVRVPALPESVADATVLTWHKQPGDAVRQDENLVDLETDPAEQRDVAAEHPQVVGPNRRKPARQGRVAMKGLSCS